jgi:hypothetical protein
MTASHTSDPARRWCVTQWLPLAWLKAAIKLTALSAGRAPQAAILRYFYVTGRPPLGYSRYNL